MQNNTNHIVKLWKYIRLFGLIVSTFIFTYILYQISTSVLYYSARQSVLLTIFVLIGLLTILYTSFVRPYNEQKNIGSFHISANNYGIYNLILDILFVIPCILVEVLSFIKNDASKVDNYSWILLFVTIGIIVLYFILPYILDFIKQDNGVKLIETRQELNRELLHYSSNELREEIIQMRPLFQREIMKANHKLEENIRIYGKIFDEQSKLFDTSKIYNNKKYLQNYNTFNLISEHPLCVDKEISCDVSGYLTCGDQRLEDIYGIYQKCDNKQSIFSGLFDNDIGNKIKVYSDLSRNNLRTLNELCKSDSDISNVPTSVLCISYNDVSNQIYNTSSFVDQAVYACNNTTVDLSNGASTGTYNKFKVILGYNDTDDISRSFNCIPQNTIEGFTGAHKMDEIFGEKDLLKDFNEDEKEILKSALEDEQSNMSEIFEQLGNDPEKMKEVIFSYFATNDNFMSLMQHINKYNQQKNIILNQEISSLIKLINLHTGIHQYNYHYGISYWLYLDTAILGSSNISSTGLIMSYGDQPKIYYDYNAKELIVSTMFRDNEKIVYKTNNILFQKWNHFVINYNYGNLDIFINNNLVATVQKLSPYIEKNTLRIGSEEEPLLHCGICNFVYYEEPLKLGKIKQIYKNHDSPC